MPELPEVETVRKGLLVSIVGLSVVKVTIINSSLRHNIPCNLNNTFENKVIKMVCRRGKHGIIVTSGFFNLHFHLGMTGTFRVVRGKKVPIKKHDHLLIVLSRQVNLIYNDVRKFGYISLIEKPFDIVNYKSLGFEPNFLLANINEIKNKIKIKKVSIKSLLLDQSIIVGIGNIYANEILFDAKVHPETPANCLTSKEVEKIIKSASKIIDKSIIKGGSSIKDYKNLAGNFGYFQNEFKVYGKEGSSCVKCKNLILKIKQGGRASFYCPKCQKKHDFPKY